MAVEVAEVPVCPECGRIFVEPGEEELCGPCRRERDQGGPEGSGRDWSTLRATGRRMKGRRRRRRGQGPAPPPGPPRSTGAAIFLSLLLPGLGQLYCGAGDRAIRTWVFGVIAPAVLVFLAIVFGMLPLWVLGVVMSFVTWIWQIYDAAVLADWTRQER